MGLPVFLADFGVALPAPGTGITLDGPEAKVV